MSSISNNRISVTLEAQAILEIKAAFQTISNNLPFLTGLTPEERMALLKISVSNKQFVEDAITVVNTHSELFPGFLTDGEMYKDFTLYVQLDELVHMASTLADRLTDTQMLAGSEAYNAALMAYKITGTASKGGLSGAETAYKMLAARFAKQGPNTADIEKDKTENG